MRKPFSGKAPMILVCGESFLNLLAVPIRVPEVPLATIITSIFGVSSRISLAAPLKWASTFQGLLNWLTKKYFFGFSLCILAAFWKAPVVPVSGGVRMSFAPRDFRIFLLSGVAASDITITTL